MPRTVSHKTWRGNYMNVSKLKTTTSQLDGVLGGLGQMEATVTVQAGPCLHDSPNPTMTIQKPPFKTIDAGTGRVWRWGWTKWGGRLSGGGLLSLASIINIIIGERRIQMCGYWSKRNSLKMRAERTEKLSHQTCLLFPEQGIRDFPDACPTIGNWDPDPGQSQFFLCYTLVIFVIITIPNEMVVNVPELGEPGVLQES